MESGAIFVVVVGRMNRMKFVERRTLHYRVSLGAEEETDEEEE